jgi:hypothetical protein
MDGWMDGRTDGRTDLFSESDPDCAVRFKMFRGRKTASVSKITMRVPEVRIDSSSCGVVLKREYSWSPLHIYADTTLPIYLNVMIEFYDTSWSCISSFP